MTHSVGTSGDHPASEGLQAYAERRARALQMGNARILSQRQAAGRLNARERLAILFESEFTELGLFATSNRPAVRERTPADGKLLGFGLARGRSVLAVSNDFSVLGATSAVVNSKKLAHAKRLANQFRVPLVFLAESAGARIPDRMGAAGRGILGQDPAEYVRDRATPWASALLGPCYGSSAWYACLSDFVVMRRDAVLAVASPRVTGAATSHEPAPEELGGWRVHARGSGLVDRVVDRDEDAIGLVLDFLDYLPSHAGEDPPQRPTLAPEGSAESLLDALPQRRSEIYDVRVLLRGFVDEGTIFELKSEYGRSICTCLARIGGRTVGLIANNPRHLGGAINAEACNKAISLIVLCDSFNIPLVSVVDQPGFLIGKDGEQRGMLGRIMNWMTALELASVPKVCLITRKSYGQAYLNMGGGRNSDVVITWPSADLGFTDVEVGRRVLAGGANHDEKDIAEALGNVDSSCWPLAEAYESHMVIDPRDTRDVLQEILAISGTTFGLASREHRLGAWPTSYV